MRLRLRRQLFFRVAIPPPGTLLNEPGQAEAQNVGQLLFGELGGPHGVAGIFAGLDTRMPQTIAPFADLVQMTTQLLPGLDEVDGGRYAGYPQSSPAGILFDLTLLAWAFGLRDVQMPGSVDFNGTVFDQIANGAVTTMYTDAMANPVLGDTADELQRLGSDLAAGQGFGDAFGATIPGLISWIGTAPASRYGVIFVCTVAGMPSRPADRVRKGEPFSVRFSLPTDRTVAEEARRTRRSKSAVVEALADEAIRTRRFAGIAFRGDDARRRPWVIGTGLDVWEIIQMLDGFGSMAHLLQETQLNERQVRLALAYRDAYPEEISAAIAENRRTVDDWRELYPFVQVTAIP